MSEMHVHDDELSIDAILEEASAKFELVPLLLAGDLVAEYEAVRDRVNGRNRERILEATEQARAAQARVQAGDDRLSSKLPEPVAAGDGEQDLEVELERDPEQDLLDELTAKIRHRWIKVKVAAVEATAYNALAVKHPPRWLDSGRQDPRDAHAGVNTDTFYDPLIRMCLAEVTPAHAERWAPTTPKQITTIMSKINPGQFDELASASARVNRLGYTNVPF